MPTQVRRVTPTDELYVRFVPLVLMTAPLLTIEQILGCVGLSLQAPLTLKSQLGFSDKPPARGVAAASCHRGPRNDVIVPTVRRERVAVEAA